MGAIGNYVHFMTTNYINYGTNKKGGSNFSITPFEQYKKQRLGTIQEISPSTISQLEMRLKENSDMQENIDGQIVNTEIQKRVDYIYTLLEEVTSTEALNKFSEGNIAQFSKGQFSGVTDTTAELKSLRADVKEFKELLDKFKTNSTMRKDTFEKWTDKLITLYNKITNSTVTVSPEDISTKNIQSVLQKVQAKSINNSFNTTQSAIRGFFGEAIVAACNDNINALSEREALEAIKGAIQGDQRAKISISKSALAGLDTNQISSFSHVLDDGSSLTFGSSQNKVDVKITVKGESVLASVKNYNLNWEGVNKWGVHLQTQSLLYALLAMINSGYANHWINLHAANIQPVRAVNISQEEVDNAVRFELLYDAFSSGNPLKSNSENANVFVLMDSKTGKVKVIDTQKILDNDLLRNKSFKISHESNITSPKIRNDKVAGDNGADIRIENIISQIHKLNVSISYDINSLQF